MKDHPDHNIAEAYIFDDSDTAPTAQDFYDIFGYYPKCALGWANVNIYKYCQTDSFSLDGKPKVTQDLKDAKTDSGSKSKEDAILNSLKEIYSNVQQFARETLSFYNQLYSIENHGANGGTRGYPGSCSSIYGYTRSIEFQIDLVISDMNNMDKLKSDLNSSLCNKTFERFFTKSRDLCDKLVNIKDKLNIKDKCHYGVMGGTTRQCIFRYLEIAKEYCKDILCTPLPEKPSPIGYIHYSINNNSVNKGSVICRRKIGGYDSQSYTYSLTHVTCPDCLEIIHSVHYSRLPTNGSTKSSCGLVFSSITGEGTFSSKNVTCPICLSIMHHINYLEKSNNDNKSHIVHYTNKTPGIKKQIACCGQDVSGFSNYEYVSSIEINIVTCKQCLSLMEGK